LYHGLRERLLEGVQETIVVFKNQIYLLIS